MSNIAVSTSIFLKLRILSFFFLGALCGSLYSHKSRRRGDHVLQSKWRHFIIGIGADDEPEVTIVFLRPTVIGMGADMNRK